MLKHCMLYFHSSTTLFISRFSHCIKSVTCVSIVVRWWLGAATRAPVTATCEYYRMTLWIGMQPRRLQCKTSITRLNSLGIRFALESSLAFASSVTGKKSTVNQSNKKLILGQKGCGTGGSKTLQ